MKKIVNSTLLLAFIVTSCSYYAPAKANGFTDACTFVDDYHIDKGIVALLLGAATWYAVYIKGTTKEAIEATKQDAQAIKQNWHNHAYPYFMDEVRLALNIANSANPDELIIRERKAEGVACGFAAMFMGTVLYTAIKNLVLGRAHLDHVHLGVGMHPTYFGSNTFRPVAPLP